MKTRSQNNKEHYFINDNQKINNKQKRDQCERIALRQPSNKTYPYCMIEKKLKKLWNPIDVNNVELSKLQESDSRYLHIAFRNYEDHSWRKKCRHECDSCENGKKCSKKKLNNVHFYLYRKRNEFFLMYFSEIIFNYYEIVCHIYDFLYRHGDGMISTDKIYAFYQKQLVNTKKPKIIHETNRKHECVQTTHYGSMTELKKNKRNTAHTYMHLR